MEHVFAGRLLFLGLGFLFNLLCLNRFRSLRTFLLLNLDLILGTIRCQLSAISIPLGRRLTESWVIITNIIFLWNVWKIKSALPLFWCLVSLVIGYTISSWSLSYLIRVHHLIDVLIDSLKFLGSIISFFHRPATNLRNMAKIQVHLLFILAHCMCLSNNYFSALITHLPLLSLYSILIRVTSFFTSFLRIIVRLVILWKSTFRVICVLEARQRLNQLGMFIILLGVIIAVIGSIRELFTVHT